MSANQLVLSLFPGIGMLDAAFEELGYCIVRGPDSIWGGDIKGFMPPCAVFGGIIGGPPCQPFSRLRHILQSNGYDVVGENLIPEFERCIQEAQPNWFIMENVLDSPTPKVTDYIVHRYNLNNRQMIDSPKQNRVRSFSFGTREGLELRIPLCAVENEEYITAVNSAGTSLPVKKAFHAGGMTNKSRSQQYYSTYDMLELQGFPRTYLDDCPLTDKGKRKAIANGVPLPLGLAVARAVKEATSK